MKIPLLSGAYEGLDVEYASQRLVNWYYEKPAPREANEGAVLPTPGAHLFFEVSDGAPLTGLIYNTDNDLIYVVANTGGDVDLFSVNAVTASGVTNVGDLTGLTSAATSLNVYSKEILIIDTAQSSSVMYVYDYDGDALTLVSDSDRPTATSVTQIDGYFITNHETEAGRVYWSALNDGSSWGDFNTATTINSPVKQVLGHKRNLYVFGEQKAEIWYNSGGDPVFLPFEYMETGIVGRTAVAVEQGVVWLTRSERGVYDVVISAAGNLPQKISTPQVSQQLTTAGWSFAETAWSPYTYNLNGHEFYAITNTATNITLVFDFTTGEWHERSYGIGGSIADEDFVKEIVMTVRGLVCTNNQDEGNLYEYARQDGGGAFIYGIDAENSGTYTGQYRLLQSPGIRLSNEHRVRISELQLDMNEAQSDLADSTINITWSKDGGRTYTSNGRTVDLENGPRLMTRKLGYGRHWVFRVQTETEGVPIIKGAFARLYGEPFISN